MLIFKCQMLVVFLLCHLTIAQTNSVLMNLSDNTAISLGRMTCNFTVPNAPMCDGITDYSSTAYAPDLHQILLFGGGHATTMRDDVAIFGFDSLKWKSAYQPTSCSAMDYITDIGTWASSGHPVSRHTYDQLVYAPNVGKLFITSPIYGAGYCASLVDSLGNDRQWYAGKMLIYDPITKKWAPSKLAPNSTHVYSSEYDPISGMIISAGKYGLIVHDPVNDEKTSYSIGNTITSYADNLVYCPLTDKMYYITHNDSPIKVYEVTLNREDWSASGIREITDMFGTPSLDGLECGWAYDTLNHVIGGCFLKGTFHAYNPATRKWREVTMRSSGSIPPNIAFHTCEYDPVNNVFIYIGTNRETWAYCYKSRATVEHEKAMSSVKLLAPADTLEEFLDLQLSYVISGTSLNDTSSDFSSCQVFALDTTVSVSPDGIVSGKWSGDARIVIIKSEYTDTLRLVVTPTLATLDSLVVNPTYIGGLILDTVSLSVTAFYHNGSELYQRKVSGRVIWTSSDTNIVKVMNGSAFLLKEGGPVVLTASYSTIQKGVIANCYGSPHYLKRINFQVSSIPWRSGWLAENGSGYSTSRGFGWLSTDGISTRDDRNGTNFLLKSFVSTTTSSAQLKLDVPDGSYIIRIGMGDNTYGIAGTMWCMIGNDTVGRKPAGLGNYINTDTISVSGGSGIVLSLTPWSAINYIIVISNEGIDIDYVADDLSIGTSVDKTKFDSESTFKVAVFPNPFNPTTTIRYTLNCTKGSYTIYDNNGKVVRKFNIKSSVSGLSGQFVWDGKYSDGKLVASGVYIGRLVTERGASLTNRLMLMR